MRSSSLLLSLCAGCLVGNPAWGEQTEQGDGSSAAETTANQSTSGANTGTMTSASSAASGSTGETVPSYAGQVLEDAPIAYWRFDEATTPTANDEVGDFPGEYQGSVTLGERGLVDSEGGAVRLGQGTRIVMGDVLDLEGGPSLSIEAWVKPHFTDDSWPKIISNNGGSGDERQGYTMEISPEGNLTCALESDGVWSGLNAPIEMGVATHVVLTHDGVTLRLYMNGVEASSYVGALPLRAHPSVFVIGSNNILPDGGSHLFGVLDEVALYDYPLSTARVQAHYLAGVGT